MSVKDVKKYYEEVANQYAEMLEELKDFSELAEKNMYEPERIDMIKESMQPLIRNYEVLSYIMFLLNMPNRDAKRKGYERRNEKLLGSIKSENTKAGILKENKDVIDDLRRKKSV